jgi:ribonuclease HI
MYFDISQMRQGAGLGLVFISPLGVRMRYVIRFHFPTSNNVAEYEALINSLRIDIRGDSRLVVDQVMKELSCLNPKMTAYCQEVRQMEDKIDGLKFNHIPRRLNETADTLAKMASSRQPSCLASSPATSTNLRSATRSQGGPRATRRPRARGLVTRRPHSTPRSCNLTRSRQRSPTLGLTGDGLTSITPLRGAPYPPNGGSHTTLSPLSSSKESFTSGATPGSYSAAFRSSKVTNC